MSFTTKEGMVRADFFKESGKWVATEALDMSDFYEWKLISEATKQAIKISKLAARYEGMWCVVLKPYHPHKHPQMFKV